METKDHIWPDLTREGVGGDGEIIVHSGRLVNVLNPEPADIDINDIAHSLSMQCRFTGHTREFYSVAQHSVLVANNSPSAYALYGLLHDASEAYLSDIARPVKKHPDFEVFYKAAEARLQDAIYYHFDLEPETPVAVMEVDNILLRTEARDLMPSTFPVYPGETLVEEIIPWTQHRAKKEFIQKFMELNHA